MRSYWWRNACYLLLLLSSQFHSLHHINNKNQTLSSSFSLQFSQMERHRCKLCSRTFANGRALGGHMKAHLATLPLPPKPQPQPQPLSFEYSSSSSSESERDDDDDDEEKGYGLRENPKRSFRVADPEFSFTAAAADATVVVQDRESETESKNKPTRTRRRSNRTRKSSIINLTNKRTKLMSFMESPPSIATEAAEPVSSVSDTSPEEDLAMCLIMLSRDKWRNTSVEEEEEEMKLRNKRVLRGKHHHHHRLQCDKCGKTFRSSGALGSHRSICLCDEADGSERIFQCPYCSKVFGSGQALGGHKRSHLLPSSSSSPPSIINANLRLKQQSFIDLNLPAPPEEDDLSVLSDA